MALPRRSRHGFDGGLSNASIISIMMIMMAYREDPAVRVSTRECETGLSLRSAQWSIQRLLLLRCPLSLSILDD